MRIHRIAVMLVASILTFGPSVQAGSWMSAGIPVNIEGGTSLDACSAIGTVVGLRPGADGFLAVRKGPDIGYPILDKLLNGDRVFVCDERDDWLGIVYSKADRDCGVTTPWPRSRPYMGPCPSGWVYRKWIKIISG